MTLWKDAGFELVFEGEPCRNLTEVRVAQQLAHSRTGARKVAALPTQ